MTDWRLRDRINLDWPPTVNHYYTVARGRKILSERGRDYKKTQGWQMIAQSIAKHMSGKFKIDITAHPPDRRRRDLDNLLKPILDSLTEYGAITDDSDIDELSISRGEKIPGGHIEVVIWRNEP